MKELTLNNGTKMPALGFGTYKISDAEGVGAVQTALEIGYRHIDTAQMYHNEAGVGSGIAAAGVARGEIFLTTKLDNPYHLPEDARREFAASLEKLGTDYVDLFLMHWPVPMYYDGDFVTTYQVMEEFVADGRARAVGVSNFEGYHIDKLLDAGCSVPAVNQVELHPYFQNREVVAYCQAHGIAVEAWSPLGRATVLTDPTILQIAERYAATAAQVVLAWQLAKGYIAIPKSVNPQRQQENFAAQQLELDAAALAAIDDLDRGEAGRIGKHPDEFDRMTTN
ncbi:MAG: aldo/keto reductase [Trueperella sp.]|nr:aldo/keto reductase [Trueperella sp.]